MNNFHNQQQRAILKLNQQMLDIIYRYTPYPEITRRFNIKVLIIFIISVFLSVLTFCSANDSPEIDEPIGLSLVVFIVVFVQFIVIATIQSSNEKDEIENQIFDFQQLNKAVEEIQKEGLYSQFMRDSLFEPITNPSSPITYADFWKIGREQDKRMEKLIQSEIETQNKNITNQQKLCVGKYRNNCN